MYSPTPPTQFPSYPMSYSQVSPLSNLNYNYAALYPPYSRGGYAGYGGAPMQGYAPYAQGFSPSGQGFIPGSQNSTYQAGQLNNVVGARTQRQLIQGIRDPSKNHPDFDINKTSLVGTAGIQTHGYQSQRSLNIQHGYSQYQYIPYQSYYIDYEPRQFIQNIRVPIQKKIKDYYAVQHIVDYVPKQIQETIIDMVPQEKVTQKLYYVPVQKQVVHLPQDDKVHVHKPTTTTVISERPTVHVVEHGQNVINRPVQQVQVPMQQNQINTQVQVPMQQNQINTQVQIPIQPNFVQQQEIRQVSRSPSPQPVRVQQRPSPPKLISQPQPQPRPIPQQMPQPIPQQMPQPRPVGMAELPRPAGGQFIKNAQVLQANQMQMQKQMNIPDSAKVNYQYSTRTERALTPQQIAQRGLQPRVIGQAQTQIISQQQPQGQFPQPQVIGQRQVIGQPQPARPAPGPITVTQAIQPQPQFSLRPTQPSTDLMRNKQVDLADSEHIDITKSTFNKTYGTSGPTSSLAPQGTSMIPQTSNKNSSAFSFAGDVNVNGSNQNAGQTVNRNSGGGDVAANRISGGTIYDYDMNRADY